MLVDFERVLLDLKEQIGHKSHHGQRELLALISRLEVANRIDESLPERALRLYGLEFFVEAVKLPGSEQGRVPAQDGSKVRALRGDSHIESEEDTHAGSIREGRSSPVRAVSAAFGGRAASDE